MRHSNSTLLLTLLLLLPGFASNLMAQASQRPNFIVVMADDLGYGDLGIYGSTLIDTPNIDLMALQGIRLNSFYSSANVCTAARGGLLTGRYPIRLDLVSDVARPSNEIHLAEDEITLAEALRFIEDNRDNPFFLYLPHSFPHVPLFVSDRFSGRSDAGLYGDVVETIDWSMGMILDQLKTLGLDDNTLVIFTSDNGPWFEGSSGPFRDRKASSWEGGLRVPFIARWPSVIAPGSVSHEPAMGIDIFPTLLKLAGGTLPGDREIDGKDIMPMLSQNASTPHEALYLFNNDRIAGVRSGRWKLVVESFYRSVLVSFDHPDSYYAPLGLLFDLERDPSETYSYTRENPEVAARLRGYLERGQTALNTTVLQQMWNR